MHKTFPRGGIHPPENKLTSSKSIKRLPVPKVVNVPISQHIGIPAEIVVKVKDKVDAAKSDKDFPTDLPADPTVQEMNFAELMPIMNINLSGDFSMDELKEYGEYLEDEIEKVPEISKVDIRGIQDKEMEISIDLYKMEISKISFYDIEQAIQNENVTISGGDLLESGIRRNVRIIGEFESAKETI